MTEGLVALVMILSHDAAMKNIQIIDGAENATFSIFQATDSEFDFIFPNSQDMEFAEDFVARVGQEQAGVILSSIWERPLLKRDVQRLHGTLFYGWISRRMHYPMTKREIDLSEDCVNEAQRRVFGASR